MEINKCDSILQLHLKKKKRIEKTPDQLINSPKQMFYIESSDLLNSILEN